MGVLFHAANELHVEERKWCMLNTCFPKIIFDEKEMCQSDIPYLFLIYVTYDEFSLFSQVSIANSGEGVVVFTLAQGRTVNVSGEEADGRQYARVECRLCLKLKAGRNKGNRNITRNA